jgi:hypothetical protein
MNYYMRVLTILLLVSCIGCYSDHVNYSEDMKTKPNSELAFDKTKWTTKDGADYPYRDKMLNDVVYNDTIRALNKDEILDLLGEPSYYRNNNNFLHYRISEKRLGPWTLHTKTMVIKLLKDSTIDWIKIHE